MNSEACSPGWAFLFPSEMECQQTSSPRQKKSSGFEFRWHSEITFLLPGEKRFSTIRSTDFARQVNGRAHDYSTKLGSIWSFGGEVNGMRA